MNKDQKYSDPTMRKNFQNRVWLFITQHYNKILEDKGPNDNGEYPYSPYAAWLLVQHMDARPDRQRKFLNDLKRKIPKHPKLKFIEDRTKVNEWILKNYKNPKYFYAGKLLKDPTTNVRNPKLFDDAKVVAKSRDQALRNAKKAGNMLLVDAVKSTNAKTQPSYKN